MFAESHSNRLSLWRQLTILEGERADVVGAAHTLVGSDALWISTRNEARRALGRGVQGVVLDLIDGFQADLLGMAHGLVQGGGRLVILCGPWVPPWRALCVWPHTTAGDRMQTRLRRPLPSPTPMSASPRDDQAALVDRLRKRWAGPRSTTALLADRGRGKSAALGLAAAGSEAWVTGPSRDAVEEVFRFAPDARWVSPDEVRDARLLLVDEAAQLALPVLRALVERNPDAHLAFATTVHGYEGTGRSFAVRFLPSLPHVLERLHHPIRWQPGDPLERWVHDVLLLHPPPAGPPPTGVLEVRHVDSDTLAADEDLLHAVFGLLIEAHYRTTPGDLQRLLDAPNLRLNVAFQGQAVVGVNLLALEGNLSAERMETLRQGHRLRGHALPETLHNHSGSTLGRVPIVRSVRIATAQHARRQGVASALVTHAHRTPGLQGTMFGATPAVLGFRRALGYRLVRLGTARGARSGEPTAVMLRPTPETLPEVESLQADLARDLPVLLQRMQNSALPPEPDLIHALDTGLPPAAAWTRPALDERLQAYLRGRSFESVTPALVELERRGVLDLPPIVHSMLEGTRRWRDLPYPSVKAAMKAIRSMIDEAHA